MNSYNRLLPGSWAPAHICWGVGNRAALVRIPGMGDRRHIEFRSGDNAANPYLYLTALMAAGLDGIERLAELPNTVCKVSGLGMFNREWQADQLEPLIHRVIDTFSTQRVMFGSNFPVDKLYRSYETYWDCYFGALSRYCESEREQMLVSTASAFYRIQICNKRINRDQSPILIRLNITC